MNILPFEHKDYQRCAVCECLNKKKKMTFVDEETSICSYCDDQIKQDIKEAEGEANNG